VANKRVVHEAIERLTRLSSLFQARRLELAEAVGLTVGQWSLLEEIETEHFIPSLFAENESTSRAAVSKVIRQLLDQKLIQVAISETDGRQRNYALTAAGKAKLAKLRAARNQAIENIWSPLKEGELAQFSEFARILIERIERFSNKGKE